MWASAWSAPRSWWWRSWESSRPVALACRKALEAYAEECATPDDVRTKDQRMVDCLVDLLLRPGATGEPPVGIALTMVASVSTLLRKELELAA